MAHNDMFINTICAPLSPKAFDLLTKKAKTKIFRYCSCKESRLSIIYSIDQSSNAELIHVLIYAKIDIQINIKTNFH